MQIRKATMKDAEALLSLYEDLGYPTTASKLSRRLEMILSQPHYGCLLAERNGEILGLLGYVKLFFFEADGSYYRILALSVAKETRRQGIASRLIDELKKQAVWNCCDKKKLEIALRDQKNENKRFSPEVLRDIESSFRPYIGDNIAKEETKKMFTDIYSRHYILHNETGITAKVNQQTICEYFEATPQNKKKPNEWKIKCMLPQYAALVS